jgi:hypothetical protein
MRVILNDQDYTGDLIQKDYTEANSAAAFVPNPSLAAVYLITKAGVQAVTLGAPVSVVDDGKIVEFNSNTANAHVITATGLLNTGSASVNTATFAAFAGAGVVLEAVRGKWNVVSQIGITFA